MSRPDDDRRWEDGAEPPWARWVYLDDAVDGTIHRVRSVAWDWTLGSAGGRGEVLCGLSGGVSVPGAIGRLGADRCAKCCVLNGIPPGTGAPFNGGIDDDLAAEPLIVKGD